MTTPQRPAMSDATVWRDGDRIRDTTGRGYADSVSDVEIYRHILDSAGDLDPTFMPFARAVLAIREFERAAAAEGAGS